MAPFSDLLDALRSQLPALSVAEARAAWEREDVTFLDVREREEFDEAHIPKAVWIARSWLEPRVEAEIPNRHQRVLVYCSGDTRAFLAARTLRELGYEHVRVLTGGLEAWRREGHHIATRVPLRPDQRARYSRHIMLPQVGEDGQRKLLAARVLLVGAGGLGSPAALYLAAAGVGTLGIVDDDVVDPSNLQRQILHTTARLGQPKVQSARLTIEALNPDVHVQTHKTRLTAECALDLLDAYDLVVDGSDNFATRYVVNDACVHLGIPNVHGSVYRFEGQVSTFVPQAGPCYRCLYPAPPPPELSPGCHDAGILGVVPGVVGVLQALEAIKLIAGFGSPLIGKLLCLDTLGGGFRTLGFARDPECAACGASAHWDGLREDPHTCAAPSDTTTD